MMTEGGAMHIRFEGALTGRDCKRHIAHRFGAPAGCAQIDIDFRFAPVGAHGVDNLLTLTVFDPHGFRGAGHRSGDGDRGDCHRPRAVHRVRIGPAAATPGYLPGPLPAGADSASSQSTAVHFRSPTETTAADDAAAGG
jgi:hypothetical protein